MKRNNTSLNNGPNKRKVGKYGDSDIFYGAYTSDLWLGIFKKPAIALWITFFQWLKFNIASMAWSANCLIKFKFGYQSLGFFLYLATLISMVVYNSQHIWLIFKPFVAFAAPVAPFVFSAEELYRYIFIEIHSTSMLIFTFIYALLGLIHVVMTYFRKGNENDTSKRGDSYLYKLLRLKLHINEYVVCGWVEPILISCVGVCFYVFGGDVYFAGWLIVSALCVWFQQSVDKAHQLHRDSQLGIRAKPKVG
ncbi:MAG: hypothetical protein AAGD96_26980 [Chloroflexota bacterium]